MAARLLRADTLHNTLLYYQYIIVLIIKLRGGGAPAERRADAALGGADGGLAQRLPRI